MVLPRAHEVNRLLDIWTTQPASTEPSAIADTSAFVRLAEELHRCNLALWNAESEIRRATSAEHVVDLKHRIDDLNLQRHENIQSLDAECSFQLGWPSGPTLDWDDAYINSDSLAQLIDKLSILALRVAYFMDSGSTQSGTTGPRLPERTYLEQRRDYIAACYDRLVASLEEGTGAVLPYKHLKVYDDSDLAAPPAADTPNA